VDLGGLWVHNEPLGYFRILEALKDPPLFSWSPNFTIELFGSGHKDLLFTDGVAPADYQQFWVLVGVLPHKAAHVKKDLFLRREIIIPIAVGRVQIEFVDRAVV